MLLQSFLCAAVSLAVVSSSAIPMWELLSRDEKMSHLFNMFVKQVADYCDTTVMPDCQKLLLAYGLTNLAKMKEESLDKMDPYQRGANGIIWGSMMYGSYKKETEIPMQYYVHTYEPSSNEGNHIHLHEGDSSKAESFTGDNYVIGPMVVMVRPDGSPVPSVPLPKDEDKEEYEVMRGKPVPSLSELHDSGLLLKDNVFSITDNRRDQTMGAFAFNPTPVLPTIQAPQRSAKLLGSEDEEIGLTPPPGYEHHESLSSIEERYQEEQKKRQEASTQNVPGTAETTPGDVRA